MSGPPGQLCKESHCSSNNGRIVTPVRTYHLPSGSPSALCVRTNRTHGPEPGWPGTPCRQVGNSWTREGQGKGKERAKTGRVPPRRGNPAWAHHGQELHLSRVLLAFTSTWSPAPNGATRLPFLVSPPPVSPNGFHGGVWATALDGTGSPHVRCGMGIGRFRGFPPLRVYHHGQDELP